MRRLSLVTLLVLVVCLASSANALTFDISGGQLMGASGVEVDGEFYNVEFLDGTCIDLFNGCDTSEDFTFTTIADATAASQALLDQVLIDGFWMLDSDSERTAGCTAIGLFCQVKTPHATNGVSHNTALAINYSAEVVEVDDFVGYLGGELNTANSSAVNYETWAVWTPVLVPEPSTASLLVLGLVGLAAKRRRSN